MEKLDNAKQSGIAMSFSSEKVNTREKQSANRQTQKPK